MDMFWTLMKESVIVSGLLTLIVWGLIAYMLITRQEVPGELWNAGYAILAFFFGGKVQAAAQNR